MIGLIIALQLSAEDVAQAAATAVERSSWVSAAGIVLRQNDLIVEETIAYAPDTETGRRATRLSAEVWVSDDQLEEAVEFYASNFAEFQRVDSSKSDGHLPDDSWWHSWCVGNGVGHVIGRNLTRSHWANAAPVESKQKIVTLSISEIDAMGVCKADEEGRAR